MFKINKNLFYFINLLILTSYFFGFYFEENSAGGGQGDYNHIANNYELIFSNEIQNIDWLKYESSRLPLHYFLTKFYLPLDLKIIKLNNFIVSIFIPFVLFLSLKHKYQYLKIKTENYLILSLSFIVFLSPYFRTTAYWMLEENFGILFLSVSSIFLFLSYKSQKYKIIYIFLNLLFIFFDFFCSQFLFVFVIINFFLLIKFFWKDVKFIAAIIILNIALLFLPLIIYYDVISQILNKVTNNRLGFQKNNFIEFFSILLIYFTPIYLIKFKMVEIFSFYKKNFFYILVTYLFFIVIFWNYQSEFLGGGAIKKILTYLIDNIFLYKLALLSSSFTGLIIFLHITLKRDRIFLLFVIPYLVFILFVDYVFQEYLDPLIIIFIFLYTNIFNHIKRGEIVILSIYFLIFLVGANLYYSLI